MVDANTARRRAFGRAGGLIAHGTPQEAAAAKQELVALRLERHIEKIVATFPALTPEQRTKITMLLAPVTSGAASGGGGERAA